MRRWLVMLMLVLLPLQFSWAAVGSVCAADTGAPAGHADGQGHGHGPHDAHGADTAAVDDGASPGAPAVDCGHCPAHFLGLPTGPAAPVATARGNAQAVPAEVARAQHVPARPDRPQWSRLA